MARKKLFIPDQGSNKGKEIYERRIPLTGLQRLAAITDPKNKELKSILAAVSPEQLKQTNIDPKGIDTNPGA